MRRELARGFTGLHQAQRHEALFGGKRVQILLRSLDFRLQIHIERFFGWELTEEKPFG